MSRATGASGAGGRGGAADQQQQQQPRRSPRYRGVRRRAWGKWVSEIRVPGTRERLWLGSYAAPEAAAVAHAAAACLLRGRPAAPHLLNFPARAACYARGGGGAPLSPSSVQRVASDAGMAADAQLVDARPAALLAPPPPAQQGGGAGTGGDAAARVGIGVTPGGGRAAYAPPPYSGGSSSTSSTLCWSTPPSAGVSRSSSAGSDQLQLVYGDISVDDIEILI